MLPELPEVAAFGYGRGFNYGKAIVGIGFMDDFQSIDQNVDLRDLETGEPLSRCISLLRGNLTGNS